MQRETGRSVDSLSNLGKHLVFQAQIEIGHFVSDAPKRARNELKGDKHHLVQLAIKNAALSYQKDHDADAQQRRALEELQTRLHLRDLPQRIECFDISNISGTLAVGSMICFQDLYSGVPDILWVGWPRLHPHPLI